MSPLARKIRLSFAPLVSCPHVFGEMDYHLASMEAIHFLSSEYVPISNCEPRSEWSAAHSPQVGEREVEIKDPKPGCLLCRQGACSPSPGSEDFEVISDPRGWPGDFLQRCSCWRAASAHAPPGRLTGITSRGNRLLNALGVSTWWWSSHLSTLQTAGPWEGNFI